MFRLEHGLRWSNVCKAVSSTWIHLEQLCFSNNSTGISPGLCGLRSVLWGGRGQSKSMWTVCYEGRHLLSGKLFAFWNPRRHCHWWDHVWERKYVTIKVLSTDNIDNFFLSSLPNRTLLDHWKCWICKVHVCSYQQCFTCQPLSDVVLSPWSRSGRVRVCSTVEWQLLFWKLWFFRHSNDNYSWQSHNL